MIFFSPEDPATFTNYTRMSEPVWNELLLLVTPIIQKMDTVMREAISPRDTLSATLRFLATGNTFKDLLINLRIAPNTLSIIVHSTCLAIIDVLQQRVIKLPTTPEEWELISEKFYTSWQFPHCIGALDGKHITFRPPRRDGSLFHNYKDPDSIILLALVDAEHKFIFVDIVRNGRMHGSTVFRESPLGERLEANALNLPEPSILPGYNCRMPYIIVGDDAFALKPNLMKPYPERGLTLEKRIFNYRLSRARRVVENAFGILANRFRVLLNPINLSVDNVEIITHTCALLHNFLLLKKSNQWHIPTQHRGENPELIHSGLRSLKRQGGNHSSTSAAEIREKFCDYFNSAGVVHWQYDAVNKENY